MDNTLYSMILVIKCTKHKNIGHIFKLCANYNYFPSPQNKIVTKLQSQTTS